MQNNTKKIIYFSTYDDIHNPFYGGGGAVAVHQTAKQLLKNFDVRVVSWDYAGRKKETIDGVVYERFGVPFLSPKIAMFCYQLFLPYIVMNKKFDIWMESFCPPFTTTMLPLFTKKSVIGIVHMLAADDMERKYKLPFHFIQNTGLRKYKKIIATSDQIRKKIISISPKSSVNIISNGIDKVFQPVLRKQKYLLYIGRIEINQKGLDLLLASFRLFCRQHKEYKLVIAGSGDPKEFERLKTLIKKENLTAHVKLEGKVAGKTKDSLFQNAACVVISSRFETYSLVALEAMSYGAPVVCFAIDALSWIPEKAVKKVKAFDVNKFADTLSEVVTNKNVQNGMIQAGNDYAKQYTWDEISKQYNEYILKITNTKLQMTNKSQYSKLKYK